jgi:predicted acyltransferase
MFKKIREKLRPRSSGDAERILFIDLFRGFMVSLMIIANYLFYFVAVPVEIKHAAPLSGVTIVDFGAPIFFFILGFVYIVSLQKRLMRDGLSVTLTHFVRRYFILWLFGLLGIFVASGRIAFGWNVLMAIGLAGFIALPFMFLPTLWRFLAGLGLLAVYQLFILKNFLGTVLAYDMGGYLGAISWAGLIIISSIWWPITKSPHKKRAIQLMIVALAAAALVGLSSNPSYEINKPLISFSYILLSYSLAVFALLIFYLVENYSRVKLWPLKPIGRNPLLMYILSGILGLLAQRILAPDTLIINIVFSTLAIYLICYLTAWYLGKKNLIIKI